MAAHIFWSSQFLACRQWSNGLPAIYSWKLSFSPWTFSLHSWPQVGLALPLKILKNSLFPQKTKGDATLCYVLWKAFFKCPQSLQQHYMRRLIRYCGRCHHQLEEACRSSWHMEDYVPIIRNLQWDSYKYANLRHKNSPGLPKKNYLSLLSNVK